MSRHTARQKGNFLASFFFQFSTGKGRQRPAILLNAGIHAREWISSATAIWTARKVMSPSISPAFCRARGALYCTRQLSLGGVGCGRLGGYSHRNNRLGESFQIGETKDQSPTVSLIV